MGYTEDVHCGKCGRVIAEKRDNSYFMGGVMVEAVAGRCPECGECFSFPSVPDGVLTAQHLAEIRLKTEDIKSRHRGYGVIALEFQKGKIRYISLTTKQEFCL
jgi:hypothetical protein